MVLFYTEVLLFLPTRLLELNLTAVVLELEAEMTSHIT